MKNACLEIALRELKTAGVRGIEQAHGGKHLQLRWRVNGNTLRVYTLPVSSSDVRSPHNVRAGIRRLLRADGVLTEQPKSPPAPKPPRDRVTQLEQRISVLERMVNQLLIELRARNGERPDA